MQFLFQLSFKASPDVSQRFSVNPTVYQAVRVVRSPKQISQLIRKPTYHHWISNNTAAKIEVRPLTDPYEIRKTKKNANFGHYLWMIDSILERGQIVDAPLRGTAQ